MKGWGLLFLMAGGVMSGMLGRMRLQQRVTALEEVRNFLCRIRERVRYASEPMEELFEQFCLLSEKEGDVQQREWWEKRASDWGKARGLSDDDCMILEGFVKGFGLLDVEGEVRFCDEYREIFEERLRQAQETLKNKGRVYMAFGVCGGLTLGLLLM